MTVKRPVLLVTGLILSAVIIVGVILAWPHLFVSSHTVTFMANTGSLTAPSEIPNLGNAELDAITVRHENKIGEEITFTRVIFNGFIRVGWRIGSALEGDIYTDAQVSAMVVTEDIVLYAQWARALRVTFDANEGHFTGEDNPETRDLFVAHNRTMAGLQIPAPVRSGNIFFSWHHVGWRVGNAETGTIYTNAELMERTFSSEVTIYAQWERSWF